jgi:hypothetical protein
VSRLLEVTCLYISSIQLVKVYVVQHKTVVAWCVLSAACCMHALQKLTEMSVCTFSHNRWTTSLRHFTSLHALCALPLAGDDVVKLLFLINTARFTEKTYTKKLVVAAETTTVQADNAERAYLL